MQNEGCAVARRSIQLTARTSATHDLTELTSDYKKNDWTGAIEENLAARDTERWVRGEQAMKLQPCTRHQRPHFYADFGL